VHYETARINALFYRDFPGFGESSMPDRGRFAYAVESLANVLDALVGQLGLGRFSLYVMDYGAPVVHRACRFLRKRLAGYSTRQKGHANDTDGR
jgi:pimeloyl-ACP methyl ester carboxylesterase